MRSNNRNKHWFSKYKFQYILSLCLITAPFLIYLHLLFKPNQKSFEILGYYIELEAISFHALTWVLFSDLSSILILCVLYFSLSDKWKYSLGLPILFLLDNIINYLENPSYLIDVSSFMKYFILLSFVCLLIVTDKIFFKKYRQKVLNINFASIITEFSNTELEEINSKVNEHNPEFRQNGKSKLLYGLYYCKLNFDKLFNKKNWHNASELIGSNTPKNIFFSLIVIFSISLWLLHYFIPEGSMNFSLGFLTINSHGYNDAQIFVWIISRMIMVIIPMVLWFISYHSWWRYAVLSPLILYLFRFWEALQDDYSFVDAYGNYRVLPLVLISIIVLLIMSRIIRRHSQSLDTYEEISEEIERLVSRLGAERAGIGDYRKRYEQIRNKIINKDSKDTKLSELIRLQQELKRKIVS